MRKSKRAASQRDETATRQAQESSLPDPAALPLKQELADKAAAPAPRVPAAAQQVQAPPQPVPSPVQPVPSPAPATLAAPATDQPSSLFAATPSDTKNRDPRAIRPTERQLVENFRLSPGASKKSAASVRRYRRVYSQDVFPFISGRDVPSTLLWQPLVITDATGHATVSFQLPATPTTYVLRADAHGDGRIGSGEATIDARQP